MCRIQQYSNFITVLKTIIYYIFFVRIAVLLLKDYTRLELKTFLNTLYYAMNNMNNHLLTTIMVSHKIKKMISKNITDVNN